MKPGDRVLIGPLGVAGTIIRQARAAGRWVVQADCTAQPVSWPESDLTLITEGTAT
jgi:hypothetical protein